MEYVEKTVNVHEEVAEKKLLDALAALLGSQRFDRWFGRETSIRFDGDKVVFGVKNRFAVSWVRANFQREVDQACFRVFGERFTTEFVINAVSNPCPVVEQSVAPTPLGSPHFNTRGGALIVPSITRESSPLYSVETLPEVRAESQVGRLFDAKPAVSGRRFASRDSFVEGLSNRLACRAADMAIHHPGQFNPIYLFGPTSVGKTHLLEGIWSAVRTQPGRKPPLYLKSEQFVSSFLESIQPGSARSGIQGFRNKFKGISILLVDDIQHFFRKEATQTEFLYVIDTLRNQGVQLVFSGDRPLAELVGLRRELLCRLEAGMVCPIEQPERETALQIFRNMIIQRQLPIDEDVCRMVASRLGSHARQLSGALNRLHAVHLTNGDPITLEVAEHVLADLIRTNRRNVGLPDIEKAVCDTFGLSEQSLQSKSRARQVATPRMLAMWLARKYTRSALSEIGKYFGDRSHSTVVTAQKKVDQWVDENHPVHADRLDLPIAEAIRKIERILHAG